MINRLPFYLIPGDHVLLVGDINFMSVETTGTLNPQYLGIKFKTASSTIIPDPERGEIMKVFNDVNPPVSFILITGVNRGPSLLFLEA